MWGAHLLVAIGVIEAYFLVELDARYLLVAIEGSDEMPTPLTLAKKGKRYKPNPSQYVTPVPIYIYI